MRIIKIVTVCSFGIGTSMILKMKVEEAFKEYGFLFEVEASDLVSAAGINCDLYFTSTAMGQELKSLVHKEIILINNFMNIVEIQEKGLPILERLNQG
ncbi:MAG: PTS sugar transporter subunit IIB [Brevinema sp.]